MKGKTLFDDIKAGLEEAVAYNNGEKTGACVVVPNDIDVKAIRKKLNMTQEIFSLTFGVPITTLRKWEQKRRQPERLSRAFFKVLEHSPETVLNALR